jgi:hypothetical protein
MSEEVEGINAQRYSDLEEYRLPFLTRARKAAAVTIPFLVPPEGHNDSTSYLTPHQSLAARGINNLAGKLLMTLFPPSTTFFRLMASEKIIQQAVQQGIPDAQSIIDASLGKIEQAILKEIEIRGFRVSCFEALRQLIAAGNVLIFIPEDGGVRVFPLDQFVIARDPEGNLLEIVVKERVALKTLPDEVRDQISGKLEEDAKTVDLFTRIVLEDGKYLTSQEAKGVMLPDSDGEYPKAKLPWLALRWTRISREEYGRGLCEEYFGDILQCEGLAKWLKDFAAGAAKKVALVRPNGMTDAVEYAEAENLSVIPGEAEDVTWTGIDKYPDFQVLKGCYDDVQQRLSYVFLLNSAIQRDAERVTAEEIRYMAEELENALGGVYSVLAEEFQLPVVNVVWNRLQQKSELPSLPQGSVSPTIVTGLDALGRSSEASRLDEFITEAAQQLGPQVISQYVIVDEYLRRKATALGIDESNLIRTDAQVQQMQQAAQQQQQAAELAKQLGPAAINQYGKMASNNQMAQLAQQQPQPTQQGQ